MDEIPTLYHHSYSKLILPTKHKFPIGKYEATKSLLETKNTPLSLRSSIPTSIDTLNRFHQKNYVQGFMSNSLDKKVMRKIGFPWSEALLTRTFHAVGGTIDTCNVALDKGLACHLSGGYHHAFYSAGGGFCIFNDLYIAANLMLGQPDVNSVLIFDLDVHQGDGTAQLAQQNDNIFTCSVHCGKNYPANKQHSDFDVPLDQHCKDDEYLQTVKDVLRLAVNVSRPDLIIYDAGVDIHEDDTLGHFDISTQGLYERDLLVLSFCHQHGIPVATVMGGGYQPNLNMLCELHSQVFLAAQHAFSI